jgi:class 3 adenylate cyclase
MPIADMSEPSSRERVVLFADISGSTAIYEQLGDAAAVELIHGLLASMEEEVYFHKGAVIKSIGDELLCTFPDVVSALAGATAMQQQAAAVAGPGGRRLSLRVGMHHGPALEDRGDVFGDAVNIAARVVVLARPGHILITDACFDKIPLLGRSRIRAIDRMSVRGRSAETTILEVMWQRGRAITTVVPPLPRSQEDAGCVVLHHGGRAYTVSQQANPFLIGRDASCQLVIATTMASRQHASIEARRGKFILTDRSTNGTFVVPQGGMPIHLRREEFVLQGSGRVSFGELPDADSEGAVRYEFRASACRG